MSAEFEFLRRMENPDYLVEGCRRFHEIEPRDVAYIVCSRVISESPHNVSYIVAGGSAFLQIWNAVYLRYKPRNVRLSLEDNIVEAYRDCQDALRLLDNERLENVDLHSEEKVRTICTVYQAFAQYDSIGGTGASKLLHLVNPSLFMMWDSKIRLAYAATWSQLLQSGPEFKMFANNFVGIMGDTRPEGTEYVIFMQICQSAAKEILKRKSLSQLWQGHLSFLKDTEFIEGCAFSETLPKMIDECNYVRWQKEVKF